MPYPKNPWMIVAQFSLIIIISAAIAGTVGGVTSQINKWKASSTAKAEVNSTLKMNLIMVGRSWVA